MGEGKAPLHLHVLAWLTAACAHVPHTACITMRPKLPYTARLGECLQPCPFR